MKHNKHIFFFDIDGTLYDHVHGMASSTLATLKQLKEDGHTVCLNTGRAAWFIPDCLSDFPFDGIVAGSGSYVEYQGQTLQDIHFAKPFIQFVYRDFLEQNIPFTLESSLHNYMNGPMAEHTLKRFSKDTSNDLYSQVLRLQPSKLEIKDNMCKEATEKPIHKISFYARAETLTYITSALGDNVTLTLEKPDFAGYLYGEAISAGCCKSNGAALLCSYAKIPYSCAIAVGDGSNDVDLIKWAATGIAMGNADESLKDIADLVCLSLEEGGISNIPVLLELYRR